MTQCEVGAQFYRSLQLAERFVLLAAQPQCSAHSPMGGRIMIVNEEGAASGLERLIAFPLAIDPALEGILPMREGQASMGAREGRGRALSPSGKNAGPDHCRRW